jgi:hypothetical protein
MLKIYILYTRGEYIMKATKLILSVGALTVYIFFPAYRYYALGALIAHGIATSIKQHRQLAEQKKLTLIK